jgi:hypothetical protein
MTEQPFDPLALWRDMLSKWETGFNDIANRNMAAPEFSRFMNQAMGMSVRMQHGLGELMGRYLTAMNMPTRADIAALGERLQGIEEQIARLTATIEHLGVERSGQRMPYLGPPRTKRPKALNGPLAHGVETSAATEAPAVAAAKPKPAAKAARSGKRKAKAS